ncbi:4'-phosphopantetheinyl transferase family protein [Streptomyces sp. NPDC059650]|uniref:4'-phosphopantetheinyl transferase family protein n=1 Tax=Streptomyces sp. NPDC059650 TaxID=3346896 RepID=UPI00367D1485
MSTYVNRLGGDAPRTGEPPAGEGVAVWSLDTTLDVVGGHLVEEGLSLLDEGERDRCGRFLRPRDRHRYLVSHVALRVLLGGYLGLAPQEVALVREECPCCGAPHGRPAVAGGGVQFSLSHSDDLAYLAFAAVPVGVDVEGYPSPAAVADILGTLHPAETAELTGVPEAERQALLARLWARKEACLKGIGTGLARGVAEPYVGSGPAPAEVPGWRLKDLPAPDAYAAALAVRTPA